VLSRRPRPFPSDTPLTITIRPDQNDSSMENEEQPLLVSFIASSQGVWRIERIDAVVGESLPSADRLEVVESPSINSSVQTDWVLRGVTSNVRYTNRAEVDALNEKQESLNRPHATRAAIIPIRKNAAWWKLAQDERRGRLSPYRYRPRISSRGRPKTPSLP
jgi:hypothetical protein